MLEVADIFRLYGESFRAHHDLAPWQLKVMADIEHCRTAYVATQHRNKGLGGVLLRHLLRQTQGPILVGTWAAATWAIRFYEKHGFRQVTPTEKDRLLRRYWSIPDRQIETSVVLANAAWPNVA